MGNLSFITIIIPSLNEEKFIGKCLDSIIANDYPKNKLEVLILDGMSKDQTKDIVSKYMVEYPWIRLLVNPDKTTPAAFNKGIERAKGNIVMILGAHSTIEKDYISQCIKHLYESNADNVGGIWKILPQNKTLVGESIAYTLSSPFGVGNAYYRIGSNEPKHVDTVWGGCYNKEVFDRIGLFNEELLRNQDIEFNLRLKRMGGIILLFPDIISYYYARSTLRSLAKNSFSNGFWVFYSAKFAHIPFSLRHLIPCIFLTSLFGSLLLSFWFKPFIYVFFLILCSYFMINIFFSFRIALNYGFRYFLPTIITFFTLHVAYGLGSMSGLINLLLVKPNLRNNLYV